MGPGEKERNVRPAGLGRVLTAHLLDRGGLSGTTYGRGGPGHVRQASELAPALMTSPLSLPRALCGSHGVLGTKTKLLTQA